MKKTLHMIGNAHLDPVWLWRWQEGFQENKATFLSALQRLDEFDDFVFTSSSAQFYEWIEENNPKMFEKIKQRIKEGRWVICGGWWVQPDCNIPSGESFARHALLAQNYFYEKFAVIANTGYNVDSFGHNVTLPQLLKKSRMDNYVFMRPGPHEKELPARTFIWESPDGSQVKAFRIPFSYGGFEDLPGHMRKCIDEFNDSVGHMMCFYGVGNHGGGPTIENIKTILAQNGTMDGVDVIFSDPKRFFADIEKDGCELPIVREDLQHHAAGCYSVQSMVKKMNRLAENSLIVAEKFSTVSEWLGKSKYPNGLDNAWKRVLFNQFHDILAGSSIEEAYDDARDELGEAVAVANRAENNAVQAIAFDINIPMEEGVFPIVVFNPHSWEVKTPVSLELGMFGNGVLYEFLKIIDINGNEVPSQMVSSASKTPFYRSIIFEANIPALGYATYRIAKGEDKTIAVDQMCDKLENDNIVVIFDKETGNIKSILDKAINREYLGGQIEAVVLDDKTDTWGHTIKKIDEEDGRFKLVRMKKIEDGDVRTSMHLTYEFNSSKITKIYMLQKNSTQIDVDVVVNWQEKQKALKFYFPVNIKEPKACCEISFGHMEKVRNGWEEPMQSWIDMSDDEFGVSILNNGKYSVDFHENIMAMTVLRSPVYAHHDPYMLNEDEEYRYMDQGEQRFTYAILPHGGDWRNAKTMQKAMLLNQPVFVMAETYHKGDMPQTDGYININAENILLSALKKSYNQKGYVARFYETNGCEADTKIEIMGAKIEAKFSPYEIKTFFIDDNGQTREVDLLEWDI